MLFSLKTCSLKFLPSKFTYHKICSIVQLAAAFLALCMFWKKKNPDGKLSRDNFMVGSNFIKTSLKFHTVCRGHIFITCNNISSNFMASFAKNIKPFALIFASIFTTCKAHGWWHYHNWAFWQRNLEGIFFLV